MDAIKNKVSTAPFYAGGASFKTHILKKTRNGFVFKASTGAILFCLLFILVGFGVFCFGVYNIILINSIIKNILLILFGALFFAVGACILIQLLTPRVFNKNYNYYYKGFKKNANRNTKNFVPLNRVVALQLIGETLSRDNGSFKSFELNLVLDDASRINVIDHGNLKILIDNTTILSNYLNIPIWHAESKNT